jgi:hypothetical protein
MADKFIDLVSGRRILKDPIDVSTGAPDSGKIIKLDSSGRLDNSFLPVGVGADTLTIEAGENLDSGDFVQIYNDGGTPKVRKADNSNDRRASGFVLLSVISGNNAEVYLEGTNTALSGMTIGARQYLGTAGDVTETAVTGSGEIHQFLGIASSATELNIEVTDEIEIQ